ncbi:hypothetical protein WJX73_000222 [Symbiochloris irregularis]|uniref:Uncharacterized protein n=1 Tax=Symbiochloris irregularis TaxID=706552 RepID=A0AAW1P2X5_9CHLO
MPTRGFHSRALELEFVQAYSRDSVKASTCLRFVQATCMAAGLRALQWEKHSSLLLTVGVSCILTELLTALLVLKSKEYHRHDQFKSYRFVVASAGYMLQVLICEKPVVNVSIFPTMSHALLIIFDQMRLQSTVNVYIVNSVIFLLCQANALMTPRLHHTLTSAARDITLFALGGFLLPCWILHNLEVQARQRFLARTQNLETDDLGEFWARKLHMYDRGRGRMRSGAHRS